MNDSDASGVLRLKLGAPIPMIVEFANRTKSYILGTQFSFLIDNYADQYYEVVRFANKHCSICFEPDNLD